MIFTPELIWFICGVALALLEFAVPGVILIFFGFGAWITAVTTHFGLTASAASQLMVFACSSVVLLLLMRRSIHSRFSGFVSERQSPEENLDEFTGKEVVVLEPISPTQPGKVEFKGAPWRAESTETFSAGEIGFIETVEGLTLNIQKRG